MINLTVVAVIYVVNDSITLIIKKLYLFVDQLIDKSLKETNLIVFEATQIHRVIA